MTDAIDLTTEQRTTLSDFLRQVLPGVAVWAYGSRVKWTARPNSDLDLVAFATPAQRPQVVELKDALAESNLPFPVDLHVWDEVPERFREIIRKEYVMVQEAKELDGKRGFAGDGRNGICDSWETHRLDKVATIIDSLHKTPAYSEQGLPMVRVTDIKGGFLDLSGTFKVTDDIFEEFTRRHRPERGDIVFSRVGTYGNASYVANDAAFCLGQNTALIHPAINSRFLHYCLQSPAVREQIEHSVVGSTQKTISLKSISALQIPVPPHQELEAIAHILGTLDDKIELNRRMNETLEAMARALFKSWFVDFDPVRAKAEGRDTGLPKHIAGLFPDSFEDSEMGKIPKGWKIRSIYEIADVVYGAPFASSQFNTEGIGEPLIRIRDLADESPGVWTPEVHPKGYKVRPGDIVVGMDGEFRVYLWGGAPAWLNQRVCAFLSKGDYSAAFVRNSIIEPLAHIESTETATTVIHLGKSDIDRFCVVAPTAPVLAAFNQSCQPWCDRIVAAKREARTLAALRDALLPKLISGELRVKDSEKFVEKVV
jgi:type I restriction enzyme, S subunit